MRRLSVRTFDKLEFGNVGAFQPETLLPPRKLHRMRDPYAASRTLHQCVRTRRRNCIGQLSPFSEYAPGNAHFPVLKSATTKLTRLSINCGAVDAPVQGRGRLQTGALRVLPAPEHCLRVPASSRQALWQAGRAPLVGASRRGGVSSRLSFWERHGTNSTRDPFGFSHGKRGG